MPQSSEQRRLLSTLQYLCMWAFLDDDDEAYSDFYSLAVSSRYISERIAIPQSHDYLLNFLLSQPPVLFKQLVRTSHQGFNRLVNLLINNPVFHANSRNTQTAVAYQVAVCLMRLGCYGNAASVVSMQRIFGIGVGTVVLFTDHVVQAICSIKTDWVNWPDHDWRREISDVMSLEGFPGCVGFVDGTKLPLYQKPALNGSSYLDKKKRYSLSLQVVCDSDRRITAYHFGWPGSAHDATVYRNSDLFRNPQKYYTKDQYILGDSAYPLSETMIPCYKAPAALCPDNVEFNFCVAHSRVRNEHCIGILKGCWSSLREIQKPLNCAQDLVKIGRWVTACIVLHNMLVVLGDSWDDLFIEEDDDTDYINLGPVGPFNDLAVTTRREELKIVTRQINHNGRFLPIKSHIETSYEE